MVLTTDKLIVLPTEGEREGEKERERMIFISTFENVHTSRYYTYTDNNFFLSVIKNIGKGHSWSGGPH
jgi:hypothetical protein